MENQLRLLRRTSPCRCPRRVTLGPPEATSVPEASHHKGLYDHLSSLQRACFTCISGSRGLFRSKQVPSRSSQTELHLASLSALKKCSAAQAAHPESPFWSPIRAKCAQESSIHLKLWSTAVLRAVEEPNGAAMLCPCCTSPLSIAYQDHTNNCTHTILQYNTEYTEHTFHIYNLTYYNNI